jgi:hypothetical protein
VSRLIAKIIRGSKTYTPPRSHGKRWIYFRPVFLSLFLLRAQQQHQGTTKRTHKGRRNNKVQKKAP